MEVLLCKIKIGSQQYERGTIVADHAVGDSGGPCNEIAAGQAIAAILEVDGSASLGCIKDPVVIGLEKDRVRIVGYKKALHIADIGKNFRKADTDRFHKEPPRSLFSTNTASFSF